MHKFSPDFEELWATSRISELLELAKSEIKDNHRVDEAYYWCIVGKLRDSSKKSVINEAYMHLERVKCKYYRALIIKQIGISHWQIGDLQMAEKNYETALDIFESLGIDREKGLCLNNIAIIYDQRGDTKTALDLYTKSMELASTPRDNAVCFVNVAIIHWKHLRFDLAIEYLTKAIQIFNEIKMYNGSCQSLFRLIQVYQSRNLEDDHERSEKLFLKLKETYQLDPSDYNRTLLNLSQGLIWKNSFKLLDKGRAIEIFEELIHNPTSGFEPKINALNSLLELKLDELKITTQNRKKIVEQFTRYLQEFIQIATTNNLIPLIVNALTIKSRFAQVFGNYIEASELLNRIHHIILDNNFTHLLPSWQKEKELLESKMFEMKDIVKTNESVFQEMEASYIEDYLKTIKI